MTVIAQRARFISSSLVVGSDCVHSCNFTRSRETLSLTYVIHRVFSFSIFYRIRYYHDFIILSLFVILSVYHILVCCLILIAVIAVFSQIFNFRLNFIPVSVVGCTFSYFTSSSSSSIKYTLVLVIVVSVD